MDLVQRFLNYTQINTTTSSKNGTAGIMPSSEGQYTLAKKIATELQELGLKNIEVQDTGIVTATLPANSSQPIPTVAFFAHLDTSDEHSADTKPRIVHFTGEDICLNPEKHIYLRPSENPEMVKYIGQDLIVTDGTSLLGADDKAGIAAIINAIQYLVTHPEIEHGEVKVAFVPDEEQGLLGSKAFDVKNFGADFAYTLDGCGIGDFVYENWNAGDAKIIFHGQSAHPIAAKGKLKNSLLMAHKFIAMLPAGEAPEYTEGCEGYFWVKHLQGNTAKTVLEIDIRDFSEQGYGKRMDFITQLVKSCNALWGENTVECQLADCYVNVFHTLKGAQHYPIDIGIRAFHRCGIEPISKPMRGGYDGAVLSKKGLPCPNIFTGGHNFHSIYEYIPVPSLWAASEVVVAIVEETYATFSDKE